MDEVEATPVSVREELERIARSDSDAGSLARILLAGLTGDVSGPTDDVPDAPEPVTDPIVSETTPEPGEERFAGQRTVTDPVTGETAIPPAERVSPLPDTQTAPGVPDDPTGATPPYGGNPAAPNTAPDNRSESGTAQ